MFLLLKMLLLFLLLMLCMLVMHFMMFLCLRLHHVFPLLPACHAVFCCHAFNGLVFCSCFLCFSGFPCFPAFPCFRILKYNKNENTGVGHPPTKTYIERSTAKHVINPHLCVSSHLIESGNYRFPRCPGQGLLWHIEPKDKLHQPTPACGTNRFNLEPTDFLCHHEPKVQQNAPTHICAEPAD